MFEPPAFHPSRPHLVAPVRVDDTGRAGPTRAQARGDAWRRTSHGLYVPASADRGDPAQRTVEAAALLPAYGAVTGWAALNWLGARWFDGTVDGAQQLRDVALATAGRTVRNQPGFAVCEEGVSPHDTELVEGLPITSAVRSTCFEMRHAPTERQAVVALSMAAYSDLVSLDEMATYAAAHSAWTGIPRCRRGLGRAVENAWSPPEVSMLLVWELDAGHAAPLCNVPIFDRAGRLIGTPDLVDPEAGVIGEYDGAHHLAGSQRAVDVARESAFRRVGLEPVVMLAPDLGDPAAFIGRLHDAYRRARREPESRRAWTIDPPPWWTPTLTVAQRRALTPEQRQRLLRHRQAG